MKTFEQQLMQEMEILLFELLENSNDNAQQKAIYDMLVPITKYLNHRH